MITKISKKAVKDIITRIKESNKIVITSHISPDDDSISSLLAVYCYITEYLKLPESKVKMIYTGEKNSRWDYFKNYEKVKYVKDLADHLEAVDLLVLLDVSGWNRFSRMEKIREFKGVTICIDHHPNPEDTFDIHILDSRLTSTSEIVYELFFKDQKLNKSVSEIIFLGIWGDTGGLHFVNNKTSGVYLIVKRLVEDGKIDVQKFVSIYNRYSYRIFKLITALMRNTSIKKIKGWPNFQATYLDRKWINKGYSDNEISYAYHVYIDEYTRRVEGVGWGFVVIPKSHRGCGISFRSLSKSVNVRLIAEQFSGGGHDRASGGKLEERDPKKGLKNVIEWVKKNKPEMD